MISYEDKDLCLYDENNTIVLHKNIHFIQPTKNKYGKYISKINNILYFKLPTIDEKDIIEDRDNNDLILKLDSENYYSIFEFLYSIDEYIIQYLFDNSSKWFKKIIKKNLLESLFITSVDKNSSIKLKCSNELMNSITSNCNIVIQFNGIEFYKSNFTCNYQIHKIINENIETVSKIDFISYIESIPDSKNLNVVNDLISEDKASYELIDDNHLQNTPSLDKSNEDNAPGSNNNIECDAESGSINSNIKDDKDDYINNTPDKLHSDINDINVIDGDIKTNIIDNNSPELHTIDNISTQLNNEQKLDIYDIENIQNINVNKSEDEIIEMFQKAEVASINAEKLKLEAIQNASEYRER